MIAQLKDYRRLVALDEPFAYREPSVETDPQQLVTQILHTLFQQTPPTAFVKRPVLLPSWDQRTQLKVLLTLRRAEPFLSADFHTLMDRLLHYERGRQPTTEVSLLSTVRDVLPQTRWKHADRCVLWQGDITTLQVDAIVNAANAALLGCFQPLHRCIDNAIHVGAGPRLREDCQRIMALQGEDEPTGGAKITRGYHLPASFVLHTVGPIYPNLSKASAHAALASSYRACLELAAQLPALRSIAFCSISTGVFGFPKEAAATVAIETVDRWLTLQPDRFDRIVFDVFDGQDYDIYQRILSTH